MGEATKKADETLEAVTLNQLFQYATPFDNLYIGIGLFLACLSGLGLPVMVVCSGEILNVFTYYEGQFEEPYSSQLKAVASFYTKTESSEYNLTKKDTAGGLGTDFVTREEFLRKSYNLAYITVGAGVLFFACSLAFVKLLAQAAANQAFRMKLLFFKSLLRQEVSWFDGLSTGELPPKITDDLKKVEDGIGEKMGILVSTLINGLSALVISFYYGWELTLAVLIFIPLITGAGGIMAKVQASSAAGEAEAYGAAGSIAQEVFLLIRTVFAYGGEATEIKRYEDALKPGKSSGIRRNVVTGFALAFMWFSVYSVCAPCIWYGAKLIIESRESLSDRYTGGAVVIIIWNIMTLGYLFGQATPYVEAIQMARGAAASVFQVIARQPVIDSLSAEGHKLSRNFESTIKFAKVHFSYPSRPDVEILRGVTLDIKEGETVAIVGPSGSGKSTLIQLVQRFYDCKRGSVSVGGVDIAKLNVGWLRQQMGIVGQEPVLFDATIKQNIFLGTTGSQADDRRVLEAAMSANAHDFISALPASYETKTGERGTQLSGGQKQRIAIARALISKPRILLLDEATSALDRESESIVQMALDGARVGRTTLVVAHRLTTVQSADRIVFMEKGQIKEIGTHEQLIERRGGYYQLFEHQQMSSVADEVEPEDTEEEAAPKQIQEMNRKSFETSFKNSYDGDNESQVEIRLNDDVTGSDDGTENSSKVAIDAKASIKLFSLMKKDIHFVLIGSIGAIIVGLACPTYAIILGEFSKLLNNPNNDELYDGAVLYALSFVALALVVSVASVSMVISFGVFGERLTSRLRRDAFRAILRQEMSWFDQPENGVGNLCSSLSSDAADVQGLSGARISTICQSMSTISACLILSLYLNWKLGLLVIAFIPIIIYSVILYARATQGVIAGDEDKVTSKITIEVVSSIKTVTSLHQQDYFYHLIESSVTKQLNCKSRNALIRGVVLGLVRSSGIFAYAAAFALAAFLIANRELHYSEYFKISEGIIFGSAVVAEGMVFGADYDKAKKAAKRLLTLIESSKQLKAIESGKFASKRTCEGKVAFNEVAFRYPTRPDARVLNGLTLDIAKGETVALVGGSGCGKSTAFQLLLNFYQPSSGTLSIDGINLETISTSWLRSKIGLVSQEPLLFDCSIGDNITYGDNSRQVPYEEIVEAAQKANIHDFVNSLPGGYDTQVGEKGGQLSGGQKQRIAIARALLRNPAILLLDEATAALDTESERIVQEALDEARQGRTCLMIAHRLSTVRNADKIAVINKGRLVEIGTHAELLAANGHYCRLHNSQAN